MTLSAAQWPPLATRGLPPSATCTATPSLHPPSALQPSDLGRIADFGEVLENVDDALRHLRLARHGAAAAVSIRRGAACGVSGEGIGDAVEWMGGGGNGVVSEGVERRCEGNPRGQGKDSVSRSLMSAFSLILSLIPPLPALPVSAVSRFSLSLITRTARPAAAARAAPRLVWHWLLTLLLLLLLPC